MIWIVSYMDDNDDIHSVPFNSMAEAEKCYIAFRKKWMRTSMCESEIYSECIVPVIKDGAYITDKGVRDAIKNCECRTPSIKKVKCKDCRKAHFSGRAKTLCYCSENGCYLDANNSCSHGERGNDERKATSKVYSVD